MCLTHPHLSCPLSSKNTSLSPLALRSSDWARVLKCRVLPCSIVTWGQISNNVMVTFDIIFIICEMWKNVYCVFAKPQSLPGQLKVKLHPLSKESSLHTQLDLKSTSARLHLSLRTVLSTSNSSAIFGPVRKWRVLSLSTGPHLARFWKKSSATFRRAKMTFWNLPTQKLKKFMMVSSFREVFCIERKSS